METKPDIAVRAMTPDGTMTLYAAEEYLQTMIDTADAATPEYEEQLKLAVQEATAAAIDKREKVARWIMWGDQRNEFQRQEIQRLQKRVRTSEEAVRKVREYVAEYIVSQPLETRGGKLAFPIMRGSTTSMYVTSGKNKIEITDHEAIDDVYKRVNVQMSLREWESLCFLAEERVAGVNLNQHRVSTFVDEKLVEKNYMAGLAEAEAKKQIYEGIPGVSMLGGSFNLTVK